MVIKPLDLQVALNQIESGSRIVLYGPQMNQWPRDSGAFLIPGREESSFAKAEGDKK